VWDERSGEELFTVPIPTCGHAVDLDSQGRLLAVQTEFDVTNSQAYFGNVYIYELATGRLAMTVEHRPGFLGSVRFSPDGRRFFTGGWEGVIVWDTETGDEQVHLAESVGNVTRAVWTSDGTRIVAGDSAGAVRIWDADTGEPILGLLGHVGAVVGLAVSPDGMWIASSEGGGPTIVRTLDLSELVEIARSRLTRTFTPHECLAYAIDGCAVSEEDEETLRDEKRMRLLGGG
jgi:WD40 repeat protein